MRHQTIFLAVLGIFTGFQLGLAQAEEPLAVAKADYREVAQTYSVEGVVEAVR